MNYRDIVTQILPPIVLDRWSNIRNRLASDWGLSGDYSSWKSAVSDSTGYGTDLILEKTKIALLKVKTGKAIYERDTILFNEIQYAWSLLAGLMWIAVQSGGRLNVLDFGGSLGSTYYQNRVFLHNLTELHWNIIEQPAHVKVGKEYFEDEVLKFFTNIENCTAEMTPNAILLSSSLQYLEAPYEILNKLLDLPCNYLIIDRTPFWNGTTDRLCVQKVPPSIYTASYPSWIFAKEKFMQQIKQKGFTVMVDYENTDYIPGPIEFTYRGMIVSRQNME